MTDRPPFLTVGYHKGEMDFGINCDIDNLTYEQMNEFRVMCCVAIGQAESMWRRAQDARNPAGVTKATLKTIE